MKVWISNNPYIIYVIQTFNADSTGFWTCNRFHLLRPRNEQNNTKHHQETLGQIEQLKQVFTLTLSTMAGVLGLPKAVKIFDAIKKQEVATDDVLTKLAGILNPLAAQ